MSGFWYIKNHFTANFLMHVEEDFGKLACFVFILYNQVQLNSNMIYIQV